VERRTPSSREVAAIESVVRGDDGGRESIHIFRDC
jgi:hypothetical protein